MQCDECHIHEELSLCFYTSLLGENGMDELNLNGLVKVDEILSAIRAMDDIGQLKDWHDKAAAIAHYHRRQKESHTVAFEAERVKVTIERREGELLAAIERMTQQEKAQLAKNRADLSIDRHTYTRTILDLGLSHQSAANLQAIASLPEADFEAHIAEKKAAGEQLTTAGMVRAAKARKLKPHHSSSTPEWYTPQSIIDRVLQVFGTVDLDPCSNDVGTPNIPAAENLTNEQDGLAYRWHGRVYMNPPYGDEIGGWIEKLATSYADGDIEAAIALLPSRTDTQWFRRLKNYPRCFIWGRLKFSGATNSAPFPSMVVYLGVRVADFIQAFRDVGDIYVLMEL